MKKKLTFFDIINNDDMETNKNENHEIEKVQSFLNQIKTINDSYERVKAITGENYNIFKLLGVESSELLHSKIIGDFLNPKGSHEQGSIFLELFMQTLVGNEAENIEEVDNKEEDIINLKEFLTKFSCSKSSLKLEKSIGKIKNTEETNEGGRIDIFLRDENNKVLIIENKIYAGEQNKQLERYNQFGSEKATDFLIIYLTLNGDKPISINNENSSKLLCISYKEQIINWLDLCKKEVVNLPIIRESVSQYINLLKKLTNQTENQNQAMEIQNLILKNIESAKKVNENYDKAIKNFALKIKKITYKYLEEYFKDNNYWEIKLSDKRFGTIWINPKDSNIEYGFGIENFEINLNNHHHSGSLFYGIKSNKNNSRNLTFGLNTNNNFWLYWKVFEYENIVINFSNPVDLLKIELNVEKIAAVIVNEFIEFFEKYQQEIKGK